MQQPRSVGKCHLCGGTFSKGAMTRHLQACRRAHPEPLSTQGRERTTKLLHLQAQGRYASDYWLHLEVPADAKLKDLDEFLRDIWLECCGHLSAFEIGGVSYTVAPDMPGDKSMSAALGKVLSVGATCHYVYDFGTTTDLSLKVVGEREGSARSKSVQVLARNDPPAIACQECGRPATQVCTQCVWEGEGWLCDECGAGHECGEEMLLPVVNSPRVGMCGYTGEAGW